MIREIELHSLDAIPALQSSDYDGWILRQAKGHTKRANSVNFRDVGVLPAQKKIDHCEAFYRALHQPCIFRLTPLLSPGNLDEILEARGYVKIDTTDICLRNLHTNPPQPTSKDVQLESEMSDEWSLAMASLTGLSSKGLVFFTEMMANPPLKPLFASIKHEGKIVACGLGGVSDTIIGLFEFATDPVHQRKGYARAIVERLLFEASKSGAEYAYLQVVQNNTAGQKFWHSMGFEQKLYSYHYRVKVHP